MLSTYLWRSRILPKLQSDLLSWYVTDLALTSDVIGLLLTWGTLFESNRTAQNNDQKLPF